MRISFTLLLSLLLSNVFAQTPSLTWAKTMSGTDLDIGLNVATDDNGNVYNVGYFRITTDFDPSSGTYNLTSNGATDGYIQKLDNSGNLLWAKSIGGTGFDYCVNLAVDNNGNSYIVGDFRGTVDLDPGSGVSNLTSTGIADIFILKLDSNGNFIWVKQIGGSRLNRANVITFDSAGNICIAGYFSRTADFDPSSGTFYMTAVGNNDAFIQKLDTNGNFIWAKQLSSQGNVDCKFITLDSSNNIYATGEFEQTTDFDPASSTVSNLTSAGSTDAFVLKLDNSGNYVWVRSMGGIDEEASYSIALDTNGNIFTTGRFNSSTVDFDPSIATDNFTSAGGYDIFLQKLDNNGNYLWTKTIGGTANDYSFSLTVDKMNDIYIAGHFDSPTIDFDPGMGVANLSSLGGTDIFFQKLDNNGNFIWNERIGSGDYDIMGGVHLDKNNNLYTTGGFSDTIDFSLNSSNYIRTSAGLYDIFIQKVSMSNIVSIPNTKTNFFKLYPNPSSKEVNIQLNNTEETTITIFDSQGKLVSPSIVVYKKEVSLNTEHLKTGIYYIYIKNKESNAIKKWIKL